jgi:hypothetical protein
MNAPVDVSFFARAAKPITSYRPYWAKRFGTAPFLPMSRAEMDAAGLGQLRHHLVTGDAYVDHPSFGMAVIGRVLEAQGFRVGIIAQPDWQSADPFKALGKPNLFWGVTAGQHGFDDQPLHGRPQDPQRRRLHPRRRGRQAPDRAAIVYSQRCREAYNDVPIVLGGIEGSLRRIAHYDYWSDKVRRSIVVDAKCDLLLYGNAERAIVEVAHRLAAREPVEQHHRRARHGLLCAARPRRPRAGSRSTPPAWTRRAAWKPHQPLPDHQRAGGRATWARTCAAARADVRPCRGQPRHPAADLRANALARASSRCRRATAA